MFQLFSRGLFITSLAVFSTLAWGQLKVDRTPPPIFEQEFAKHVTPLEDVLEGRTSFPSETDGGVILLSERLEYVNEDGTRYRLYHNIDYGNTESGADSNEELTYSYDSEHERIYLIRARSIQEDGTSQDVQDKATFIQSPQYEASNSLYTSESELKIIFPNVKIGTVIEALVLVEDFDPIVKEEIGGARAFAGYWPVFRNHLSLDLPKSYADRINFDQSKPGVPEPVVSELENGRVRYDWVASKVASEDWESSAPGGLFRLPSLWWSTFESWDKVAAWFHGLVSERDELGEELERLVEEWTEGVVDRKEIIDILTEKVANDIRYTGLEFGLAGHQPYACALVWENQYGDCKDKANLLRALLRAKGIESHMTLLSTDGHGLVNRTIPRHGQFNHVILAVPEADGSYRFIDPTIEYLAAGNLGFGDSGRDVLIVAGDKAIWERTADNMVGGISVSLDFSLDESGELSGWITLEASGSDASYYTSVYNEARPENQKTSLLDLAEGFLPGISLLDINYTEAKGSIESFKIRGYFIRKSGAGISETLNFPFPVNWLPDFQAKESRETNYRAIRRIESLNATITLPEGYSLAKIPTSFDAISDGAEFKANWAAKENQVTASLEWFPKKALLSAEEFLVYRQSVNALKAWLEGAVPLSNSGVVAEHSDAKPRLENFPMLSSGESQLLLVEEKYPDGDNDEYRKLALEQVIQWFPNDPDTVFEATLNIYRIGWTSENSAKSVKKIKSLLKKFGSKVTVQNRVWGEFLLARGMWSANKSKQAPAMLLKLAENEELSAFRRGWSAYEAAVMIMESDEKKALGVLKKNMGYGSEARSSIDGLYARLRLQQGAFKDFVAFFEGLDAERGDYAGGSYHEITRRVVDYWSEYSKKTQGQLHAYLDTFYAENLRFEDARENWAAFSRRLQSAGARTALELALREYLDEAKPAWFSKIDENSIALVERIINANDSSDVEALLNASMNLILAGECGYEEFVEYGRWAMWWMNRRGVESDLLDLLGELSLELQGDDEAELYIAWQMFGERYRDAGQPDLSRKYFNAVISNGGAKRYQKVAAAAGLAQLELGLKRTEAALAAFDLVEKDYNAHADGSDFLLLDGLFRLELGQYEKALEVFRMISLIEQKYIDQADFSLVTGQIFPQLQKGEQLLEFWKHSETWWPKWQSLCEAYNVEVGSVSDLYAIDDFDTINSDLSQASKDKDVERYFAQLRVFAMLAKWVPIFGVDLSNKVDFASEIDEKLGVDFAQVVIEAIGNAPVVDRDISASLDVRAAVLLINADRYAEAISVSKRLVRNAGTSSSKGQSGLRLWLASANFLEKGYEEPTIIMKDLLGSDVEIFDRPRSVRTLSDLYYVTKNYPATVALFESESKNEVIAGEKELVQILETRVNLLQAQASRVSALTESVSGWLDKRSFNWFAEIPPYELDKNDPKFNEAPIEMPNASIGQEFKANILFALDEENPIGEREDAFLAAVIDSLFFSKTADEVRDRALDVVVGFPLETRPKARVLLSSLIMFASESNASYARELLDAEFTKTLKKEVMSSWRKLFDSIELYNQSPDRLGESMEVAISIPINYSVDNHILRILKRMVYLGQADLADEWFEKTKSMTLGDYADKTLPGYRLGWMRAIKEAKSSYEFDRALRDVILRRLGVPNPSRPEAMDRCVDWMSFHKFSEMEARDIFAYMFDTGIFPSSGPDGVCYYLNARLLGANDDSDFGLELLELLENVELPDHLARGWIGFGIGAVDVDIAEFYQTLNTKVAAFLRSDSLSEETKEFIEIVSRSHVIRTSDEAEPESLFSEKAEEVFDSTVLFSAKLRFHYSRGQWDALGALLEANDYTVFEDLTSLAIAYQGLLKAGREDEAFLMRDVTASKIEEHIATSWTEAPSWVFGDLLSGCIILEDGDSVTERLSAAVLSRTGENFYRKVMELELAYLSKDWVALEKNALEALDLIPDFYDANGYLGMALARKNEIEEAKTQLELFLNHSRDSILYQKAKALHETF